MKYKKKKIFNYYIYDNFITDFGDLLYGENIEVFSFDPLSIENQFSSGPIMALSCMLYRRLIYCSPDGILSK